LLLHGEYSKVVTPEIVSRMQAEMADCRTQLVRHAGHALFTDQPQVFADSVAGFLADTDA
jgi:pimeloyl-ACP methyl ester carboxylesterase